MNQLSTVLKVFGALMAAVIGVYAGYALYADDNTATQAPAPEIPAEPAPAEAKAVFGPGAMPAQRKNHHPHTEANPIFPVGPDGDLVVNEGTVVAMRDALSAYPAKLSADDRQRLEAAAVAGLPEQTAARALALMRSYTDYQHAQDAFDASEESSRLSPQEVFDRTAALRKEYFDRDTVSALFGKQEAEKRYDLEVIRLASDTSLTPAEKTERINSLRRTLPPDTIAGPAPAEVSVEYEQEAAALRERGAPESEMQQLWQRYYGERQ